jgi:hypothetical protein
MPEGYVYIEVQGDRVERLTFRRDDKPGALVEVTLNQKIIHVEPRELLLAMKTITEGI